MTMAGTLTNFLLFQASWFACVLAGAGGRPWLAVAVAAVLVCWHLARASHPRSELALIGIACLIGAVFDGALAASGLATYSSPNPAAGLAPAWIVAMWGCFATTLNVSLRWLRFRPLLSSLFGLAGGPLAYVAGAALGGVDLAGGSTVLAVLGAGWAAVMPVLMRLAARFDGWREEPSRPRALAAS